MKAARPTARAACTTRTSISRVLSTTTQNGGNDFSGQSFVQHRNMYVIPWAFANVAHYRSAGSNGLRAPGEYKGGAILALDAKTGEVLWDNWDKSWLGLDMAHGQTHARDGVGSRVRGPGRRLHRRPGRPDG